MCLHTNVFNAAICMHVSYVLKTSFKTTRKGVNFHILLLQSCTQGHDFLKISVLPIRLVKKVINGSLALGFYIHIKASQCKCPDIQTSWLSVIPSEINRSKRDVGKHGQFNFRFLKFSSFPLVFLLIQNSIVLR